MHHNNKIEKFSLQCSDCSKTYSGDFVRYLCPDCNSKNTHNLPPKGVLKVLYDYNKLEKDNIQFEELKKNRYIDLLPLRSLSSLPNLKIGDTPVYHIRELENEELGFNLYLKDDSCNPTFSFKDRASAIVSAFAKENNLNTIVTASTGNAGSSIAGICAAQRQKAIVIVPESAPLAKLSQILMYGANIIPVKGSYDDAFDLSVKATEEFGWYNRNTAFNPFTIEGKKIVSFEIFDAFSDSLPDRIFVPVGDGVILSAVYKGFEDLLKLNIIEKIPTIVAVQAEGSNNLISNITTSKFKINSGHTLADSIAVDIPRNFYMAKQFIQEYKGESVSVTDDEILKASYKLSRNTGLFAEPAAAAAFAGMISYMEDGKFSDGSRNLVLLTGSGLKDIKSIRSIINMPESIQPDINELIRLFK